MLAARSRGYATFSVTFMGTSFKKLGMTGSNGVVSVNDLTLVSPVRSADGT